jgi:hypothetical protein
VAGNIKIIGNLADDLFLRPRIYWVKITGIGRKMYTLVPGTVTVLINLVLIMSQPPFVNLPIQYTTPALPEQAIIQHKMVKTVCHAGNKL